MAKWTEKTIKEEVAKYTTLKAFRKGSKSAFNAASTLGIYHDVTAILGRSHKDDYTYEGLSATAAKYTCSTDFIRNDNAAYTKARRLGILPEICAHMPRKTSTRKWNEEAIRAAASKYETVAEFRAKSPSAYRGSKRLGIVDDVCKDLVPTKLPWTHSELCAEAAKYDTRGAFQYYSHGAYLAAAKRGILTEITTHMPFLSSSTDLSKKYYMYYVQIITLDNSLPKIYKIGITKHSDILRRFKREAAASRTIVNVIAKWEFADGYGALNAEQNVIKTYSNYKYEGESPLNDTLTSEMFNFNILSL